MEYNREDTATESFGFFNVAFLFPTLNNPGLLAKHKVFI